MFIGFNIPISEMIIIIYNLGLQICNDNPIIILLKRWITLASEIETISRDTKPEGVELQKN